MAAVDLLRHRLSSGVCGRCATLVAGRNAPEQLLALVSQQNQARSRAGASPELQQLEPALGLMVNLSMLDWRGLLMVLADILLLLMLPYVLHKAADLGLLDQQSDKQRSLQGLAGLMSVQQEQQSEGIQPQQEQHQPLDQDQLELPEVPALLEVPYTAISSRLSRPWLVGHGAAPRSILQGNGAVRWNLGEGSFARVYVACYHGQPVVVKELKGCDSSEQQQHRFQRQVSSAERAQRHREAVAALFKEAAMMEASRHSSVVQCLALCKEPPALVMEWCYGGNLFEPSPNFLQSASAVDVVKLLHDGAAAVAHLHSQERPCRRALVHGDLRACNVLLKTRSGPDWGIKVADFGMAEWLQPDGTAVVRPVTNHRWVAPEVVDWPSSDFCTISTASEVYMFGMLMYEVLTGQMPYQEEVYKLSINEQKAMQNFWNVPKQYGVLQLPPTMRFSPSPAVQSQLRELYTQCTSPNPCARPSMDTVVQLLNVIINLLVAEGG